MNNHYDFPWVEELFPDEDQRAHRNLTPEVCGEWNKRYERVRAAAENWPFSLGVHNVPPGNPLREHVGQLQAQLECLRCGQSVGILLAVGATKYQQSAVSIRESVGRHILTMHPEVTDG